MSEGDFSERQTFDKLCALLCLFYDTNKQNTVCCSLLQSQPHDEAPLAALCVSQLSEGLCEQELLRLPL